MKKLHETQERLLELLIETQDSPLTIRDIQEKLNLSTTSLVTHHINQLEKQGYLKRNPSNPRDYTILSEPEKPIAYLNLYGLAQCGPDGSVLDGNPIDRIAVSTKLFRFPAEEAFLVKAKGDSMEPKIQNGDFILARKTNYADDGDIVVCVNDEKVLIKKINTNNEPTILNSLNQKYQPFTASEDFRIEGVVKGIFSHSL